MLFKDQLDRSKATCSFKCLYGLLNDIFDGPLAFISIENCGSDLIHYTVIKLNLEEK